MMFTAVGYLILVILAIALVAVAFVILIAVGLRWLRLNPAPRSKNRE